MWWIIHWDVEPDIFSFYGLTVRWYGLLFMLGFIIGSYFLKKLFILDGKNGKDVDTLTSYIIIGTIIGARLGHCIFYQPDYYLFHPIEILKIWKGGLASHGGAIGILFAIWLYSKKKKNQPYLWILDRSVIFVALGGFFIRLGNLANSEIIGKPTELPWGFVFEKIDGIVRHPAQLYEALSSLFLCLFLLFIYFKTRKIQKNGLIFSLFLIILFSLRFLYEFIKENQVGFENELFINMGQILSIPFVLIGIIIFLKKWKEIKSMKKKEA